MKSLLLILLSPVLLFHLDAKESILAPTLNSNMAINYKERLWGALDFAGFEKNFNANEEYTLTPDMIMSDWYYPGEGIPGSVQVMVIHNGDLYVGGCFEGIYGAPDVNYLARWDGCNWYSVISGLDDCVNTLVFDGNDLYLGGNFSGHVAKWDGNTLTYFTGINQEVLALAVNDNGVYVGGYFTDAGGNTNADGIALWNGSSWSALGSGIVVESSSLEIVTTPNDVFIGGSFVNAGGVLAADYVARWDGSNWQAMGNGLNDVVESIQLSGSDVYACGSFTNAGGNPNADKIARWDGTTWNNVFLEAVDVYSITSMLLTTSYIYVSWGGWWECTAELVRYNLDNDEWESLYYPSSQCPVSFNTIVEFEADIYCSWADGWSGIAYWGEPGEFIEIEGVPYEICEDANAILLPTTQSGYTGTWSGPGVSNNYFNPYGQYDYVELVFTPDNGACEGSVSFYIYVFLYTGYLSQIDAICEMADPISLVPYQNLINGNWSGTGVFNNTFNPNGLDGYYILTFTPYVGQCVAEETVGVVVYPAVIPEISGIPNSICEDNDPILLPEFQDGIFGEWSGPGVANNTFDPSGLDGSIILAFTPSPPQCALENSTLIEVNPVIIITITGIPNSLCQLSSPISLPITQSEVDGNWSGPGVSNNTFNPDNLEGNITLTFTPDPDQCAYPTETSILIFFYTPVISGVPDSVCEYVPPFPLPTMQSGFIGNWTGPGVSNNIFDPTGFNGAVTLTFSPDAGQCAIVVTQNIVVDPPVIPFITGVPNSICALSPEIELPDIQEGIEGNWSGPGVADNYFDPSNLNGEVLLYFFPDPGQCALPNNTIIIVEDAIIPSITGVPSLLCEHSSPQLLPDVQDGFPGNWSGPGVVNNYFDPSDLNGEVLLIFIPDPGQCTSPGNTTIIVEDVIIPSITGVPPFMCEDASPILLPHEQSGFPGNWSGPGVINNFFDPTGQNGNILLTFTPIDFECAASNSWNINIDTSFIPELTGLPASVCQTDLFIVLNSQQSGFNGTWSGPGVSNDTFRPAGLEGIIHLTFTPNSDQCAVPVEGTIVVNVPIHPVLSLPDSVCQNDDPVELSSVQDGFPGTWAGPGIESNFFNPAHQSGSTMLFFLADNGTCEDTAIAQIFVQTQPSTSNLIIACDSVSNTYTVSFDIIGGDSTGYTIDGVPLLTGKYISEPYPFSATYYSFVLEDGSDCGPVSVLGSNSCLCFSDAGTMNFNEAPFKICRGPKFTVTYNGDGHPDADDLLMFVLHDNAGNQLGNVYAVNSQPVFHFIPGLLTGYTYYISSVTGTNNGNGSINFLDPCLSVSKGVPVIFFECETDVDNTGPVSLDKMPFDQPFNEETDPDHSYGVGNGINGKMQTNYLNLQWTSIIDDPHVTIKKFNMYDLYGRFVYNENDIQGDNFLLEWNNNIRSSDLVPGVYVFTIEVEKRNGEVLFMNGCRVMVW